MWPAAWTRSLLALTAAVIALSLAVWVESADRSYIEAAPSALVDALTFTAAQDTFVDESTPDPIPGQLSPGVFRLADVGMVVTDQRVPAGNQQQTLLLFSLGGLPQGATVLTATLNLYQQVSTGPAEFPIRTETVAATWPETVTWSTKPVTSPPVGDFVVLSNTIGWKSWDVTSMVTAWVGGATPNYGILLRGDGSTVGVRSFRTKDWPDPDTPPRLTVWYAAPTQFRPARQPLCPQLPRQPSRPQPPRPRPRLPLRLY